MLYCMVPVYERRQMNQEQGGLCRSVDRWSLYKGAYVRPGIQNTVCVFPVMYLNRIHMYVYL